MLRGSYDFIGINYYTTYYAQNVEDVNYKNIGFMEDARVNWPGEFIYLLKRKNSQNKKNTRSKTLHFLTYVDVFLQGREMEYQ